MISVFKYGYHYFQIQITEKYSMYYWDDQKNFDEH